MKINRNIGFLIFLFYFTVSGFAQENADKMGGWFGTVIKTDLGDNLKAGLEIQERTQFNVLRIEGYLFEPKLDYNLSKSFRIGTRYRLTMEDDLKNGREWGQRAQMFIRYNTDIDDFELKIKSALQYKPDEFNSPLLDVRNKLVSRNSVQVAYNWFGKKMTPSAGYELFYHMNNPNGAILYRWRAKMVCNYDFQGKPDVDFFYLYDREFNIEEPENAHIVGVSLNFEL